ncbi:unnamed protein product [Heterobilharzia americana]|nr:unnamed protein product [Heterobilharzia americana]
MLCDYESSVHSSDDGNLEDVRKHTKAASMHKSGTNSAVKRGLASGFESPKSSPTTMSRLPASYAIDGKCRSSSRERSPSIDIARKVMYLGPMVGVHVNIM